MDNKYDEKHPPLDGYYGGYCSSNDITDEVVNWLNRIYLQDDTEFREALCLAKKSYLECLEYSEEYGDDVNLLFAEEIYNMVRDGVAVSHGRELFSTLLLDADWFYIADMFTGILDDLDESA